MEARWYLFISVDGEGDVEITNLGHHESDSYALDEAKRKHNNMLDIYTPIGLFVVEPGFNCRYVDSVTAVYNGRRPDWALTDKLASWP